MAELILHQYEISPFSEKVRRIFAYKRMPYTTVRAPAVMPKPDLLPLTGGYRKVPVLQRGNHVYCDSRLIARWLEALRPEPTLYPAPLAESLADWADTALFDAVVPVIRRPTRFDDVVKHMSQQELAAMPADRKAMGDPGRSAPGAKVLLTYLRTYLERCEGQLAHTGAQCRLGLNRCGGRLGLGRGGHAGEQRRREH